MTAPTVSLAFVSVASAAARDWPTTSGTAALRGTAGDEHRDRAAGLRLGSRRRIGRDHTAARHRGAGLRFGGGLELSLLQLGGGLRRGETRDIRQRRATRARGDGDRHVRTLVPRCCPQAVSRDDHAVRDRARGQRRDGNKAGAAQRRASRRFALSRDARHRHWRTRRGPCRASTSAPARRWPRPPRRPEPSADVGVFWLPARPPPGPAVARSERVRRGAAATPRGGRRWTTPCPRHEPVCHCSRCELRLRGAAKIAVAAEAGQPLASSAESRDELLRVDVTRRRVLGERAQHDLVEDGGHGRGSPRWGRAAARRPA